jgi:hypothetical protein
MVILRRKGISMSGPGNPFANDGRGISEILRSAENALIDARNDDFVVATERGAWHWRTVETRSRRSGPAGARCLKRHPDSGALFSPVAFRIVQEHSRPYR